MTKMPFGAIAEFFNEGKHRGWLVLGADGYETVQPVAADGRVWAEGFGPGQRVVVLRVVEDDANDPVDVITNDMPPEHNCDDGDGKGGWCW